MKKNKSVFMAILGGLALCLICVGIVSLFQNKTQNNMEGNEELPLGDIVSHTSTEVQYTGTTVARHEQGSCGTIAKVCPDGYSGISEDGCMSQSNNGKTQEQCTGADETWYVNGCYTLKSKNISCASCSGNGFLIDGHCYDCPAGSVQHNTYCYKCPDGTVSENGKCYTCPDETVVQNNKCYTRFNLTASAYTYSPIYDSNSFITGSNEVGSQDQFYVTTNGDLFGTLSCSTSSSLITINGDSCGEMSTGTVTQDTQAVITIHFVPNDATFPEETLELPITIKPYILAYQTKIIADDITVDDGGPFSITPSAVLAETGLTDVPGNFVCYGDTNLTFHGCGVIDPSPVTTPEQYQVTIGFVPNDTKYTPARKTITVTVNHKCTSTEYKLYDLLGNDTGSCVACNNPGQYKVGTNCITCGNEFHVDAEHSYCHIDVPAGSYYNGSQVLACPVNTYSSGGTYMAKDSGNNNQTVTSCTACESGSYSPIGSDSINDCKSQDADVCTLTLTPNAQIVSPSSERAEYTDDINRYPDTFNVELKMEGNGCNNKIVKMSSNGAARSAGNAPIPAVNGKTINLTYETTTTECIQLTINAQLYNNDDSIVSGSHASTTIEVQKSWSLWKKEYCTTNAVYDSYAHSYQEANARGENYYAIALDNPTTDNCKNEKKLNIYRRGCHDATSGGSDPTPTPTSSTQKYEFCCKKKDGSNYVWKTNQTTYACQGDYEIDETKDSTTCKNVVVVVDKCYQDSDGGYHWTSSPEASWVIVDLNSTQCKNEPACYESPAGVREWGLLYNKVKEGYKLITSIKDEELCTNPTENDACYVNNNDPTDYKWSSTAPAGYTKVELDSDACQPELCYLNSKTEKWEFGKYANKPGYYKIEKEDGTLITSADECITPLEGCYKDKKGNHEWGDYSKDPDYTLIPELKTPSQCNPEIPTPKTDIDTAKIVYIFMAILMAAGVAFIYYSAIAKKHE